MEMHFVFGIHPFMVYYSFVNRSFFKNAVGFICINFHSLSINCFFFVFSKNLLVSLSIRVPLTFNINLGSVFKSCVSSPSAAAQLCYVNVE